MEQNVEKICQECRDGQLHRHLAELDERAAQAEAEEQDDEEDDDEEGEHSDFAFARRRNCQDPDEDRGRGVEEREWAGCEERRGRDR